MQGGAATRGSVALSATHLPCGEGVVLNQNDEGTTAMIDMKRAQMIGGDPADRPDASYWYRPEEEDSPENIWADDFADMCRAAEISVCPEHFTFGKKAYVKTMLATESASHRNAARYALSQFFKQVSALKNCPIDKLQYEIDCLLVSYELIEDSQTQIAGKHGVTRAAVSKKQVTERNRSTPQTKARLQKSIEARKVYALRQMIVGQTRTRIDLSNQQKDTNEQWITN
jgi:hypothetical protein